MSDPLSRGDFVAGVGARIRELRHARGLTQADVAAPTFTKAYISMLESGRTRASMRALEHIASRLNVAVAELLMPSVPAIQLPPAPPVLDRPALERAVATTSDILLGELEDDDIVTTVTALGLAREELVRFLWDRRRFQGRDPQTGKPNGRAA